MQTSVVLMAAFSSRFSLEQSFDYAYMHLQLPEISRLESVSVRNKQNSRRCDDVQITRAYEN